MAIERQCLLDRWSELATGLFDLGYAAGSAERAFENYRKARYFWGPGPNPSERSVGPEVVDDVVNALCGLTELPAKIWHKPDEESAYLLDMLVRNQVRSRGVQDLCNAAWEAGEKAKVGDYRLLEEIIGGGHEVADMLTEPCGQSHMEAIVGCQAAGDSSYCESLKIWRETREDVMKTGHKARIPEETLRALLEEVQSATP